MAYPDVIVKDLTPDHEFLVLACDGIWDVMTNDEVVDFVRTRIASRMEPEQICEELMTRCLAPDCQMGGLGCDNMTVVLVCFLRGDTYEELANKCSRVFTSTTDDNVIMSEMSESSASDVDDDCLEDTRPLQDIYQCGPAARDTSVSTNRQTTVSTENPPSAQIGLVQIDNSLRENSEITIA